jgi:hypothetical protein
MKSLVIYRCCDSELDKKTFKIIRPDWFCKLKCFKSSIDYIDWDTTDFFVIYDGEENSSFYKYIIGYEKVSIKRISVKSNRLSLLETFKYADAAFDNGYEVVYFLEDDYLHTTNGINKILQGAQSFGLVTGFDHLDRYKRTDDITNGKDQIAFSKKTNCHWRTAESTTCTWACNKEMWTKIRVDARNFELQDRRFFRHLYSEKGIRLWTPIPGVSTTLDITTFSPGIDWEYINSSVNL